MLLLSSGKTEVNMFINVIVVHLCLNSCSEFYIGILWIKRKRKLNGGNERVGFRCAIHKGY